MSRLCNASQYSCSSPATTEQVEKLLAECYPVVRETVTKIEAQLMKRYFQKYAKKMTPYAAHEIALQLIAATGGEILV